MRSARDLLPGLALCVGLAVAASLLGVAEHAMLHRAWLEPLVLAILLGAVLRSAYTPGRRARPGITFAARQVLEVAIVLLGLTLDLPLLLRAGPLLGLGIVVAVGTALGAGYLLGRGLGLSARLALLVACGNAICGNSAIAAVAPVIGAKADEVASSIAFTAVLGVVVVLALPLLMVPLGLTYYQYGVLAGLTVYAVPQVLAATLPVSALSAQVGTLVKLTRVLMLGPIVLGFSLVMRGRSPASTGKVELGRLVPWFIVGFLALAALRATGAVPLFVVDGAKAMSAWLTIVAMAALGLGVDVRVVGRVGRGVTATAVGGLLVLGAIALALIRVLHP